MTNQQLKRKIRTRNKIKGSQRPRVTVFRSNRFIFAQIIDDSKKVTLVGLSEKNIKATGTKSERAKALGLALAQKAKAKKINEIVFDRGSYAFHGRVKSLAEGLREGGLNF
jgi:large subunit ribosomal protein L18